MTTVFDSIFEGNSVSLLVKLGDGPSKQLHPILEGVYSNLLNQSNVFKKTDSSTKRVQYILIRNNGK